jgi:ribosome-associated protein
MDRFDEAARLLLSFAGAGRAGIRILGSRGMDEGLYIRPGFTVPEAELRFSYSHSSGPGGQNVNKTATKTRLKWNPAQSRAAAQCLSAEERERLLEKTGSLLGEDGSIQIVSDRFRSRLANQEDCRDRLVRLVRKALRRPKKRIPTRPTRASKERVLKEKRKKATIKKLRRRPTGEE